MNLLSMFQHKNIFFSEISKRGLIKSKSFDTSALWLIDLNHFKYCVEDIVNYLSEDERISSNKIKFQRAYDLYCLRKGIKRILIGSYLGIEPTDLRFDYNKNGKPYIANEAFKDYRFNLSHSKNYILIGIDEKNEIGVDVEVVRPKLSKELIEESLFSNEEKALYNRYNRDEKLFSIYKAWVQKEAVSKALSLGIAMGFNKTAVSIFLKKEEEYEIFLKEFGCVMEIFVGRERDCFISSAIIKS